MSYSHLFVIITFIPFVFAAVPLNRHLHFALEGGEVVGKNPSAKIAFISRQASELGVCPTTDVFCALDDLCCTDSCCSDEFPNCTEFGCVDDEGQTNCTVPEGIFTVGTLCPDGDKCCSDEPYTRCSLDNPKYCVDEDGFVGCGKPASPGVLCTDSESGSEYCCQNPQRCCSMPGGCCDEGTGGAESVAPIVTGVPGVPPKGKPLPIEAVVPVGPLPPPVPATPLDVGFEGEPSAEPISPEPSPEEEDSEREGTCFPGHVTVQLKDGSFRTMQELRTGDFVRVSDGEFSQVFMWTHRDANYRKRNFITLRTATGQALTATVGHMVYVCRELTQDCRKEIVAIEDAKVGDGLFVVPNGSEQVVLISSTEQVVAKGLYNPQTMHGDIVVNGVLSTCYTRRVPLRAAHCALAPLRALYRFFVHDREMSVL